jgi:formyltetrahydrofolate deformylase
MPIFRSSTQKLNSASYVTTSSTNFPSYILTLSCDDKPGIVAAVAGFITQYGGFITESAQFGDPSTNRFFLRMEFATDSRTPAEDEFKRLFHEKVGNPFAMRWSIYNTSRKPRVLILVSKISHCFYDLMHRYHTGSLKVEIPAVVSNHPDMKEVADWYRVPFYHFPLQEGQKDQQEAQIREVIQRHSIDLVVLARYMQILSPTLCEELRGRAINIHHSFLPSFKGAKPYHQAYDRGVKIIGATAHYVTSDLDEGPIIEQEVARVDHTHRPDDLTAIGRDIESRVLARAVKFHIEHRVLLNGSKTVVFR